jgi:hypothetical protein
MRKKLISVDFDGVLHSYTSGWKGADNIPDVPVDGAIEWLERLCRDDRFSVCIYSSRNSQSGGITAMMDWLIKYGFPVKIIHTGRLTFPQNKPPAHMSIDDRAMCFVGTFPELDDIITFKPWNKK